MIRLNVNRKDHVLDVDPSGSGGTAHCWNTNREAERFVALARRRGESVRFLVVDVLEGHLSRLAAERATADQVGAMRRILEQHREKLNTVTLGRDQGLGFHTLLAKAAGNMFLEIAVDMIWSWNKVIRERWADGYPVTGQYSYPDHCRIFNAIAEHDPTNAERAMHAHYDVFIDNIRKQFVEGKAIRLDPKAALDAGQAADAPPAREDR